MELLNSLRTIINAEKVQIDNNVFKMHYKVTVPMLLMFAVLLTSKQYVGDAITCDVESDRKKFMDTYCWIYGTFTVKTAIGTDDMMLHGLGNEEGHSVIWQMYYQWVGIVLCLQALLFYLPHYLWVLWEKGRISFLVKDLEGPVITSSWSLLTREHLLNYMVCGRYNHDMYAFRYIICEVLNFLNVLTQLFLMNWLLRGEFSIIGMAQEIFGGLPFMQDVFPKLSKCKYMRYGPSGNYETHDTICVLSLNILNEKLYFVLWFWMLLLTIVSFAALINRACVIFSPKYRTYLLMAQIRHLKYNSARRVIDSFNYGDFFLLHLVGENINPIIYRELVYALHTNFA